MSASQNRPRRFDETRRRVAVLAVAAQVQADRRAESAKRIRATGANGVIVTADALETDAQLLRQLATEGADYHALLGELARVDAQSAEIIDLLAAAGEPGPVV